MTLKARFFKQHTLWLPRWWVVVLVLAVLLLLAYGAVRHAASFLAVTKPVNGKYLIVEGWQDEYSLQQALQTFYQQNYALLITTGGPDTRQRHPEYATYAEQSAAFFLERGVARDKIAIVPAPASAQNRTYLSAVMVRKWFAKAQITPVSFDIFTAGVHARRTWTLYQMAFGPEVKIGVYALQPRDFDLSAWWQRSAGAKSVITEWVGLMWVACCFHPGKRGSYQEMWGVSFQGKQN